MLIPLYLSIHTSIPLYSLFLYSSILIACCSYIVSMYFQFLLILALNDTHFRILLVPVVSLKNWFYLYMVCLEILPFFAWDSLDHLQFWGNVLNILIIQYYRSPDYYQENFIHNAKIQKEIKIDIMSACISWNTGSVNFW